MDFAGFLGLFGESAQTRLKHSGTKNRPPTRITFQLLKTARMRLLLPHCALTAQPFAVDHTNRFIGYIKRITKTMQLSGHFIAEVDGIE